MKQSDTFPFFTSIKTFQIFESELDLCYESWGTNMQGKENSSKDEPIEGDKLETTIIPLSPHEYYEVFPNNDVSAAKEEYYEVFPYNGDQGKILDFIYKSLIIFVQPYKKTCSTHLVHPSLFGTTNLFTYTMPMHRKRVRLRLNCDTILFRPLLEVS